MTTLLVIVRLVMDRLVTALLVTTLLVAARLAKKKARCLVEHAGVKRKPAALWSMRAFYKF